MLDQKQRQPCNHEAVNRRSSLPSLRHRNLQRNTYRTNWKARDAEPRCITAATISRSSFLMGRLRFSVYVSVYAANCHVISLPLALLPLLEISRLHTRPMPDRLKVHLAISCGQIDSLLLLRMQFLRAISRGRMAREDDRFGRTGRRDGVLTTKVEPGEAERREFIRKLD